MVIGSSRFDGRRSGAEMLDSVGPIRDWVALGAMIRGAAHLAAVTDLVEQARTRAADVADAGVNGGRSS